MDSTRIMEYDATISPHISAESIMAGEMHPGGEAGSREKGVGASPRRLRPSLEGCR